MIWEFDNAESLRAVRVRDRLAALSPINFTVGEIIRLSHLSDSWVFLKHDIRWLDATARNLGQSVE
jgi:hypothetical protein